MRIFKAKKTLSLILVIALILSMAALSMAASHATAEDSGTPSVYLAGAATPSSINDSKPVPDVVVENLTEAAEAVAEEIADNANGTVTVQVAEEGSAVLPAAILQAAKENNVTLEVILPSGLVVTIDPAAITEEAVAIDLNVEVIVTDAAIEVSNAQVPANSIVFVPSASGAFGFEMSFTVSAEELAAAGLDGSTVKLYYVDSLGNVKEAGKITRNDDGSVTITISHASAYILTGDDVAPANPDAVFIRNLYVSGIGRTPENAEVLIWTERLGSGEWTGKDVASSFFLGVEMQAKREAETTDSAFITSLYAGMLGRVPDEPGYAAWLDRVNSSMTDSDVFDGFADSDEFGNVCRSFGITP